MNFTTESARAFGRELGVRRVADRPVIEAGAVSGYGPIFNAGVIVEEGRLHLFARGVRDGYERNPGPGARFLDYVSDVLVFTSDDGREYAFQQVLVAGGEWGVHCYEDPRVQRVHSGSSESVVMTYTNLPSPETGGVWRIGVHRLGYAGGRFFLEESSGGLIGPGEEANKDAVIFNLRDGRVALIHRLHPNMQVAIFDSLEQLWASEAGYWDGYMRDLDRHTIITPAEGALGVGAGAPPVEVDDELVLFYHERDRHGHYTAKVALLDDETGRVRAVLRDPIMRPELAWERSGDVDNVVFVQGAVMRSDGTIYLTYGAADRHVGAAVIDAGPLLGALRRAVA
jgi:beta-1,2-mannobiose phosphorylase / 1,2-beta-oligomannan phosphorylase